jgi:beta-fructofuranosidase
VLDEATMTFKSMKTGLLDLDAFYAPKTQLDAQGRRILWGWIPERRPEAAMRAAGWSGMMSLPRWMRLDADGTLRIQTLPQVSMLRAGTLPAENTPTGRRVILPNASGEVLCTGARGSGLQWTISDGAHEILRVNYSPERHAFLTEGGEVVLQPADVPTLHAFVDGSVVELILGERIGYTKRFYFDSAQAPDITVLATGAGRISLEGWKISPISNNRLTTPAREA